MIKNVIFDVGQVLVAWEPVEAMRALGMDEETVRAVADATVHTSDWDEADRGALSDEELLTGFIRKAPAYEAQIRNFWEHVDLSLIHIFRYCMAEEKISSEGLLTNQLTIKPVSYTHLEIER